MKLRHFAITQQGQSHLTTGDPCQDHSGSCRVVNEKLGIEMAFGAIADGVGTCVFSQDGSRVAVGTVLGFLMEQLPLLEDVAPETLQALIRQAFETAAQAVEDDAATRELPYLMFDSTLTVAILMEDGACHWGHVGDDGVVALFCDGSYGMITTRHKGEERNSVVPLAIRSKWSFGSTDKPVAALAMMTDGVLDKNVAFEDMDNRVYYPFFAPMFKHVMEDDEDEEALREMVDSYLASPESRARISDDITFVLLQNTELLPGVTPVPFDEEKWLADVRALRQQKEERLARITREREMERYGQRQQEEEEYLQPDYYDLQDPEAEAAPSCKDSDVWKKPADTPAPDHRSGADPVTRKPAAPVSGTVQPGRSSGAQRPAPRAQRPEPRAQRPEPRQQRREAPTMGGFLARLFGWNKPVAEQRLSVWLKDGTELQCRGDAVMDCGDAKFYQLLSDAPCALIAYSGKLLGSGADDVNIDRMQRHVENLIRFAAERELPGAPAFLWPEQVAYDQNGRFVGYVLPSRPSLRPAYFLFDSAQRRKLAPDMSLRDAIELARQLVEMVGVLHGQGIFLGSIQPGSLMIDEEWQLSMVRTDRLCRGVPTAYTAGADLRYLAPELWHTQPEDMACKDLAAADAYTLAVMLFELFTGGMRLQKNTGRKAAQREFSTIFSSDDRTYVTADDGAYMRYCELPLPPKLHDFFFKAFGVTQDQLTWYPDKVIRDRPTVAQWKELLEEL